jgi:iron complex outermembrane receptor protein
MRFLRPSAALSAAVAAAIPPSSSGQQPSYGVPRVERIEVTGTNISRIDGETGLPVQVITRDELDRSGIQTVGEILERVSAHQSVLSWNDARGIGDTNGAFNTAALRGLGSDRTLVLVNGRRMAPYALSRGSSIDVSAISVAAIERIEILKDGASAIYGTDAIGGVVNFILRKDFSGVEVNATGLKTEQGGGGSWRANATTGYGNLEKDHFNVLLSVDHMHQHSLRATDREFSRTSYRPSLGIDGTSGFSAPANISQQPGFGLRNPGTCSPPESFPSLSVPVQCRFDPASLSDILPPSQKTTVFARVASQLGANLQLFAEASRYHGVFSYRIQPAPIASQMLPLSPFYPATFVDAQPGGDSSLPLAVSYRLIPLGPRVAGGKVDEDRVVAGAQGLAAGWEYQAAASYTSNREVSSLSSGYVSLSGYEQLFAAGAIDPFGNHDEDNVRALRSIEIAGKIAESKASSGGVDFKVSRDVANLRGGPFAVAAGLEVRREKLRLSNEPVLSAGDIVGAPQEPSLDEVARRIASAFLEANMPLAKGLEANFAIRSDRYSDFGATTNPKLTIRWDIAKRLLARASVGTGFRAPSLYDVFQPEVFEEIDVFPPITDEVRCPVTKLPRDCDGFRGNFGGNPRIQPERSRQANVGLVIEDKTWSASLDYYWVEVTDLIGRASLSPQTAVRGPVDPDFPELPGPILFFDLTPHNLGRLKTSGVDLDLRYRTAATDLGRVAIRVAGTYVARYGLSEPTFLFPSGAGHATNFAGVSSRWRHHAALDWTRADWGATLAQTFQNGYYEPIVRACAFDCPVRRVGSYSLLDLQLRYAGIRNAQVSIGVNNLLDRDPPVSIQRATFQVGFDPNYADPRGRTFYVSLRYALR